MCHNHKLAIRSFLNLLYVILSQFALRGKSTAKFPKLYISRLPTDVLRHSIINLRHDLCIFETSRETIDEDFTAFHAIIMKHLDKHAPIKIRRVKSNRLPYWYSPKIGQAQIAWDRCKRLKHWAEYKHYRNKTRNLIRNANRQHFTNSI